jgi:hypothetical protein
MVSNAFGASIEELKLALDGLPPTDGRYKLISGDWVLHNAFREKQIKDELFSCKEKVGECEIYKRMAFDVRPEVKTYLVENPSVMIGGMAATFSIGLIFGFMISKK